MNSRVALAVFVLLILAVAVGWFTAPGSADTASAYPVPTTYQPAAGAAAEGASITTILTFMIVGAGAIGLTFFSPQTPKGPRLHEAPLTMQLALRALPLLVEGARRGLAYRHQELQVVLALLQTVDQQIDRLMRIEAGQYATQLVQHRRFVGTQQ